MDHSDDFDVPRVPASVPATMPSSGIHAFPKPITYTAPAFRGSSATVAPLMRSELGPARLS